MISKKKKDFAANSCVTWRLMQHMQENWYIIQIYYIP